MKSVIPAAADDIDEIMDLVGSAIRHMDEAGIFQWDEVYPDRKLLLEDIFSRSLYMRVTGGTIRGIIVLNEQQSPEYGLLEWQASRRPLIVHRLCVHPDSQGQGVAGDLMDFAEEYAGTHGFDALRLDAFMSNPRAVALYVNRGYTCVGSVRFRKGVFNCYQKIL